jgi:hypothetical protein
MKYIGFKHQRENNQKSDKISYQEMLYICENKAIKKDEMKCIIIIAPSIIVLYDFISTVKPV